MGETLGVHFLQPHELQHVVDALPSLVGVTDPLAIRRGVCMAGHKALYAEDWGGLPDKEFLSALDPKLADLRDRLGRREAARAEELADAQQAATLSVHLAEVEEKRLAELRELGVDLTTYLCNRRIKISGVDK